jgi:hypothetical protein
VRVAAKYYYFFDKIIAANSLIRILIKKCSYFKKHICKITYLNKWLLSMNIFFKNSKSSQSVFKYLHLLGKKYSVALKRAQTFLREHVLLFINIVKKSL